MKAPKADRRRKSEQSVSQDPGLAPLTELSGDSPEIPREVDALTSRRPDLRGEGRQPATTARLGSQPQLEEETLRWPQWEEVEPSMLRQQVPESLALPQGQLFVLSFPKQIHYLVARATFL